MLQPALFEALLNMTYEQNCHFFVGEVACGRWAITACRQYLGGICWKRVYYIIVLLLIFLLVLVFRSLVFPIIIIVFINFIILLLLFLHSFPTLNLVHSMLLTFLMNVNLAITLTAVIIWFFIRMFLKIITTVVMFLFSRVQSRIILLSERVTYVLKQTPSNILSLRLLVAISY